MEHRESLKCCSFLVESTSTSAKPERLSRSGQLQITWPALTVTKAGFQTYTQELSGSP